MKYKIVLLLRVFFYGYCEAHNPNEAYFKIKQVDKTIEIEAEFPWTMRNALLAFSPALKLAKSQKEFELVFFEYIQKNLQLTDKDDKKMPFRSFNELKNNGHTHGNTYLLIFEGENLAEIKNTIMFDISDKQTNYHTLLTQKSNNPIQTTPKQPSFDLDTTPSFSYWYFLIFLPLIFDYFYLRI